MDRLPELVTTERLTLRRWAVEDAQAMNEAVAASIDHLRPWMAWAAFDPPTVAEREALIRQWQHESQHGGDSVYGVFDGKTVVGGCGLHRRIGPGGLEIGYWIHVDHTRRGYATETARGLTTAALGLPAVERVEIHHDKANQHSGRVAKALGYTMVGETADGIEAPGESGISCRWVMKAQDWSD